MSINTEHTFESAIELSLIEKGGYKKGNAEDYSPELGLFKYEVLHFLQETQPDRWEQISQIHGDRVNDRIIQRLIKEIDLRGSLDVLRNGFTDYGIRFQMVYFKPASGLNPDALKLYNQNELKVYRQIYFSSKNKNSVDVVLSVNGIPVATAELKNQFTGQNTTHAINQYETTRDNREWLFAFKKRCLVHFAIDQDDVYMCTKLDGKKTYWLPFNKGYHQGKGNPPNPDGYRTSYLWEKILVKDSWLDIIKNYVQLEKKEIKTNGKIYFKEILIFPRYHQLDAVRKITADALANGSGKNYLIQHSAGSGKSNSIAWLSYKLSSLHNLADKRVFDSVIVITDRLVLDEQLQNTIYQIEHKTGLVKKIDKDSNQLAEALVKGTNIIITTLQKFPFVLEKIGKLPKRKYAVIIDEAHSSQGGEASKKMKEALAYPNLAADIDRDDMDDDLDDSDLIRMHVRKSAETRGTQDNISFFAFTATPKYKTLEVFGRKNAQGKPEPFHLYSMRQAIEENFILDVLENYTTYSLFYRLTKSIEDDPKLNKKKAAKAIGKFISLHPHNLSQKTQIIIEHFRNSVSKKIGGKAKAMLVCGSRLHAKRYYEEFGKYIKEKGYQNEMKVLVAFSGKVVDDNTPDGVSEPQMTGFSEKELPGVFEKDEYKILIVADKYQTGFDQPLLHTMYVDKKLSGVKAVQTLSRLNRIHPGKTDTFVLDFVNDRQTILDSFQPYYELTTVTEETDVNHLFDLKNHLDQFQVYWQKEINDLVAVYFHPLTKLNTEKQQSKLYAFTDPAVDRYKELEKEKQDEFKKGLRTWINLYSFLSQIMPFPADELEEFFAYARLLQKRLPKNDYSEQIVLDDEIALEYYRLQKIQEGAIQLQKDQQGELSGTSEAGLKRPKEEEAMLSEIITVINERFGTEFVEADKLFFDQIEEELYSDSNLGAQARANKMDTFKYAFDDKFMDKLISRMDQNQEMFERIVGDDLFGAVVREYLMKRLYQRFNK
ncbi:MAG: type I restriction endonuclease [Moheibacter sp.]